MRKVTLFILFSLLVGGSLSAQSIRITGSVTDANDNSPLVGVTVTVKNSNTHAFTNTEGKYTIDVPNGTSVLSFSYIGYETLDAVVGNRTIIDINLYESVQTLQDVVIVGYGSGRDKRTLTASVANVGATELKDRPTANVMDALQGKVAGLLVFNSSGEPSSSSSVRLHGTGSLGAGSTPLYVLDGAPIDVGSYGAINPNDIESITILKDAAATSIYGSRASNGVIYITTKKGKANQDAVITVRGQYGISTLANKDYFNGFMNSKELTDLWVETGYRTRAQVDDLLKQYPYDTKWIDYYYKDNVPTYQGDISIRGGGGKTNYYVSGGLYHADGLMARSYHNRYTTRTNVESQAKPWLKFGLNTSLAYSFRNTNGWGSNSMSGGLFWMTQPFYTPYDSDGKPYDYIPGAAKYSPWYLADKNPIDNNDLQLNGTFYADITPIKGLILHTQSNIDAYDQRVTTKRLPSYLGNLNSGTTQEQFYRNYILSFTNTAEYKFNVAEMHGITLLAGHEFIKNDNTYFMGSSAGQTDDRLTLLTAGPNSRNIGNTHTQYAYLSWFGRVEYDFEGKYFLSFNARNDKSSRFGKNNRSAIFYSAGVLWNLKAEKFLQNSETFTDLKFRASYGSSGNSDIGNYDHWATINTSQYAEQTGWGLGNPGNSNLTWEKQNNLSVSIDATLFKKLNVELEYYNRVTSSMLMDVPYPYTSGFSTVKTNVGKLQNQGIDVTIDYDIYKTHDWKVNVYTSFNYNQGKVLELFQGRNQWTVANTGVSYVVGKPVMFYYPLFAGVDPADGSQTWYLPNETDNSITTTDPSRTTKEFNSTVLEQNTGKLRFPPFNGGFGLSAEYKGISLSSHFAFSKGKYLINNDRYFSSNPANFAGYNQHREVLDYWKKPGDITTFPKYGQVLQFDDHLLEDASFLRLKTLTLGYSMPKSVLKKTPVFSGVRIFATGRNLLTFTGYNGPDPEVDSNLTYGRNPNTKEFTFGLEVSF